MINTDLSEKILTIGPAPDMKGGIAQVLDTYFSEVYESPKFIPETVNGNQLQRVSASFTALFKLIHKLLTDKKIQIVHLHTATKVSFPRTAIYAKIARMLGRKTITHVHGANFDDYYRSHKAQVTKALKATDQVVALSNTWRDFFRSEIGIDHVTVIPNIISTPHVEPKEPSEVTHALFLGLLGDRKGIFDLLDAIESVQHSLRGRFILHVGGNGEVEKFQNVVKEKNLTDLVEFHGWVRAEEKDRLLNLSKIFILPSYGEGLPISILEAMAYGNAVISTPVGGIPEVVDSANGVLVTPGDVKALASAITTMIDDQHRLESMGKASLSRLEPHRSSSVSLALEDMYHKVLSK